MTTTTEFKPTPSCVASELFSLRNGFAVLHGMIQDLRDAEGEVTEEFIYRMIWTADHISDELKAALDHADELAAPERAAFAIRAGIVLQAAE